MKQTTHSLNKLFLAIPFVLFMACSEDEVKPTTTPEITAPVLSTATISSISYTSSISGGTVISDGGSSIIERGTIWATTPNPTIEVNVSKTVSGTGTGSFVSELTDLLPNTQYYVRAYAFNEVGVSYGNELTFTTNELGVPVLSMGAIQNIGYVSAFTTVDVTDNAGSAISKIGICWSTSSNPSVDDFKTELDNSSGISGELFKNLDPNTTYYARSFAINSVGVGYGPEVSFTTLGTTTDIDGNVYGVVKVNGKLWMKENLKVTKFSNGDAIPTTTNNVINEIDPKYQWVYNNDNANLPDGRLYTWFVATDSRNVCPSGFHVPSLNELGTLGDAAYDLRQVGTDNWTDANGTNTTGFNAVGAGLRVGTNEYVIQNVGMILVSTDSDPGNDNSSMSKFISVNYGNQVENYSHSKKYGISIRCTAD